MSTKELYTALLTARMDAGQQMIYQMDAAIHECIQAEREINALNALNGSADLLHRRLKLILCEEAAKQYKPIEPNEIQGSETEQMQALANAVGCPKITALMK